MKSQRHLVIGGALVALTVAVFAQVRSFEFVNYDDNRYVFENPYVLQGVTPESLRWAFANIRGGSWHPWVWLSFLVDVEIFGPDAGGFHLTNVAIHVANTILLYGALVAMTQHALRSGFVAALFAVHPLHVESVAWVTERKDLLSAFFGVLALCAYVRYARAGRWRWYVLMLAAFLCSLMSKQMLVTLPFVFLLLDYWPLERLAGGGRGGSSSFPAKRWSALVVEKLPLIALAIGFGLLVYWSQLQGGAMKPLERYSLATRFANAVVSYGIYVRRTIWPVDLAVFYPHPGDEIPHTDIGIALAVLVTVSAVALVLARRRPSLIVGWLWFLGTLVPVIGIVQIGLQQMSDRYTYFPLIGLFLGVAWATPAGAIRSRPVRLAAGAAACAVIAVAAVVAWRQTGYWRNTAALFAHAVAVTKDNVEAHMNLASALGKQGRTAEELEHYQAALAIEPDNHFVHQNLGRAYQRAGRIPEAIEQFRAAVEHQPDYALGHYSLGLTELSLGHAEAAINHLKRSAALEPRFAPTHYELGNASVALRQWDAAAGHFARAVELDPSDPRYRHNLGVALAQLGRYEDAAAQYEQAIRRGLATSMAYLNLAASLERMGRPDRAAAAIQAALRVDPGSARAHNEYGKFLARRGRRDLARRHFEAALRIDPNFADAKANLAALGENP